MNLAQVLAQLNDLPRTFRHDTDPTYVNLISSLATAMSRYTHGVDALMTQVQFTQAEGKWLDVWGLLFGLPRHVSEGDAAYLSRVAGSLVAGSGPPIAIEAFIKLTRNISAMVGENFPAVGWTLSLPGSVSPTTLSLIEQDINRVRPAGVPYSVQSLRGGLFLSTINYVGRANVTGSYLVNPYKSSTPAIPSSTNNAKPLLPTVFLTDPILNPLLNS